MREIRVVTPDGHVWFVRRRWGRRRMPWRDLLDRTATRRRQARQAQESKERLRPGPELGADPDLSLLSIAGFGGQLGQFLVGLVALGVVVTVLALVGLGWLLVTVARPSLFGHLSAVLGVVAGGVMVGILVLVRRPWLIEAERLGLDDAPKRVWRVIGWRRSGQCVREVAGAIEQGRLEVQLSKTLPQDGGG